MSNPEIMSPGSEGYGEIVEASPSALAILNQSEHAAMVQTANLPGNRRNLDTFSKRTMEYANHSQEVALSMFYTLPRANKQIVGPSVRYAEIVAPCWRNNSTGTRMIGSTEDTVTAQGVFIDYESNNRNVKEIPRRITDKEGRRFNSDMILTTGKAALSIAYREAVLKGGVPMALWNPAYDQAKLTAVGKAVSHAARIDAAMEYLNKLGVSEWQILNSVGVTSPKELEIDHLVTLKTLCEEIKKGTRTIEEVFGSPFDKEIEALFTQLKKNETEKRLLRDSYMGRAKDLVEYLRGRVGAPQGQTVTPAKPTQTATQAQTQETKASTEQKPEQASQAQPANGEQPKRGRGRPSKEEMAARQAAAAQEAAAQKEQAPAQETAQAEPEPEKQPETTQDVPVTDSFKF
jgi:hypothetical protein